MTRTILYYPTIDIPNAAWLRNALLYYDEVSSIVPQSWDDQGLNRLSPDIHYLIEEGQFRPMRPEDLMNIGGWENIQSFQEEVVSVLRAAQLEKPVDLRSNRNFPVHRDKIKPLLTSHIHRNKTTDNIYDLLNQDGLAVLSEDGEWIQMEESTALIYMAILAKYLADVDGNQTTIGTDNPYYEKINFKRVREPNGFPAVSLCLNKVLPSPRRNVPFERIIEFKRQRQDELINFKVHLADFHRRLSHCTSHAELKDAVADFQDTLIKGVNDLNAVMLDSRIETIFKSFKSLINIHSPTTLLGAGTLLNAKYDIVHMPIVLQGAAIATTGIIELAGCYVEARNRQRAGLRDSPFSYLLSSSRAGITKWPGRDVFNRNKV